MARKEWSPRNPDIKRAADSVVVLVSALAKRLVGADVSREERELDRLTDEARQAHPEIDR